MASVPCSEMMPIKMIMKIDFYSSSGSNSNRFKKRRFVSFSAWLGEGMKSSVVALMAKLER